MMSNPHGGESEGLSVLGFSIFYVNAEKAEVTR
jgi:hypothetical protein